MKGLNTIAKPNMNNGEHYNVVDIWRTIQGEGPYAGHPAVFIRLGGCNLRCEYCDTAFESYSDMVVHEILENIRLLINPRSPKLAVITGGEPLLYDLSVLINALHGVFPLVQIETAGTIATPWIINVINKHRLAVVVSPKTAKLNATSIIRYLQPYGSVAYKYIVRATDVLDEKDGLPMTSPMANTLCRLSRPYITGIAAYDTGTDIYIQPCDEQDEQKNERNIRQCVKLCTEYGYILSLQQHKVIGVM